MLLAFALLLVLKLAHVIAWSWWAVCAPLMIEGGILLVTVALGLGILRAVDGYSRKYLR